MVSVTPSSRIIVPGFSGTARPGGTSVVFPSGNVHCQGTLVLFRIPAAPAMAGCGTTVPIISDPSSCGDEEAICLRRIVVPCERARRTSLPGRWMIIAGGNKRWLWQCQQERVFLFSSEKFSARQWGQAMIESFIREKRVCHSPSVTRRSGSCRPSVNARMKVSLIA